MTTVTYQTKQGETVALADGYTQWTKGSICLVGEAKVRRSVSGVKITDNADGSRTIVVGLQKLDKATKQWTREEYLTYLSSGQYDRDNGAY